MAYWYLEPPRRHGPPQLRRPPHEFHGQGLHLGWANNSGPAPSSATTSGGGSSTTGTDTQPPGGQPPGTQPPGDKPAPADKKPDTGGTQSTPGSTDSSGSTDDKRPVIFGGPSSSSSDCDPAIFDDCGPGQPQQVTQAPENPPRIGYVAVHAPDGQGQAVLRRLIGLFPPEQVRPLDPGPEVILVLLQE